VPDFDPHTPSIARVYDYFLGGKDNFAADREVADRQIAIAPLIPVIAVENRRFLARAVTWVANQGAGQFIDLGCGMPTVPNTHESARVVIGDARVAYVDNDPVVLSHLEALVAKGDPGVTVVAGDVREVSAILDRVREDIDLSAPVCLVMGYLLHFFAPEAARDLVAEYSAELAPGSYVVLSAIHADSKAADEGFGGYSSAVTSVYNHSVPNFAGFFGPMDLVPPGVVDARKWQPAWEEPVNLPKREGYVLAGVARIG
jgi:O-methyltransferase involved in polyketide biosynthesis